MRLILSPVRMDARLVAELRGGDLVLNGVSLGLSGLAEGEVLSREEAASPWICGDIRWEGGELHVPLILPHGALAPDETLYPEEMVVGEGAIVLPAFEADIETHEDR